MVGKNEKSLKIMHKSTIEFIVEGSKTKNETEKIEFKKEKNWKKRQSHRIV